MSPQTTRLEKAFIDKQHRYLIQLRAALLAAAESLEAGERRVNSDRHAGSGESEDDAQGLAILELDGILVAHAVANLDRVERALRKIEEGTYGVSDVSGQPISRERLAAVPEAICTVAEEMAFERQIQHSENSD